MAGLRRGAFGQVVFAAPRLLRGLVRLVHLSGEAADPVRESVHEPAMQIHRDVLTSLPVSASDAVEIARLAQRGRSSVQLPTAEGIVRAV